MQLNSSGQDCIRNGDVKSGLDVLGLKLPNHEVRDLLQEMKRTNQIGDINNTLSKSEFKQVTF